MHQLESQAQEGRRLGYPEPQHLYYKRLLSQKYQQYQGWVFSNHQAGLVLQQLERALYNLDKQEWRLLPKYR